MDETTACIKYASCQVDYSCDLGDDVGHVRVGNWHVINDSWHTCDDSWHAIVSAWKQEVSQEAAKAANLQPLRPHIEMTLKKKQLRFYQGAELILCNKGYSVACVHYVRISKWTVFKRPSTQILTESINASSVAMTVREGTRNIEDYSDLTGHLQSQMKARFKFGHDVHNKDTLQSNNDYYQFDKDTCQGWTLYLSSDGSGQRSSKPLGRRLPGGRGMLVVPPGIGSCPAGAAPASAGASGAIDSRFTASAWNQIA